MERHFSRHRAYVQLIMCGLDTFPMNEPESTGVGTVSYCSSYSPWTRTHDFVLFTGSILMQAIAVPVTSGVEL